MDDHQAKELRRIIGQDPGVRERLHSHKRAAGHLRRRGFFVALGRSSPNPPLAWTSLPGPPSVVHGHAWLGLDEDTLLRTLALGFLPLRVRRPTVGDIWAFAQGRCRSAMLVAERMAYLQEAVEDEAHVEFRDPFHPTIRLPKGQRADAHEGPELKLRCRATGMRWVTLLDHLGNSVRNPNHSAP